MPEPTPLLALAPTGRHVSRPRALARAATPLAAAWLVLLTACAGPSIPEPHDTGKLVFWEIRSADGATAHLLGTIHVGRDPAAFDPAIEEALAASEALVMEVDPEELDPELVGQLLLQKGLLDDGRTLREVLEPETWELLEARLEERGIPVVQVLYMEPWVAMLTLVNLALAEEGFDPEQGVERQVLTERGTKPVLALESAAFQFELFDDMSLERQERMLRGFLETSDDPANSREGLERLFEAWRLGDLAALEALGMPGRGEDEDADAFYETLYRSRNHTMATRLQELMREQEGPLFVMIGALHTVGAEGVPALLAEQGHAVRRIPRTGAGGL